MASHILFTCKCGMEWSCGGQSVDDNKCTHCGHEPKFGEVMSCQQARVVNRMKA